jgi:HK97 family phage major capsid protein
VRVPGKSRQTIAGTIPEGVWTEACATLNELAISFSQIEVDGYKVGGFIPVCNALLEDSDVNLADEIMFMIGQAIGYALDKAILYGTGTKMPVGIVTRLIEESEPAYWNDNAYTWTDLHTTNVKTINPSGLTADALFSAIILAAGVAKANYSTDGAKFWAMNSKTFATLQAKALSFNAAGAIVSGQNMTMPIIGGEIVILEFIPDNDIIGGYGQLYLLAERAGAQFAVSEHVRFIDDQTVFKGTARYDGMPVFGEGFVAFNIANTDVTTSVNFASDTANP